MIAGIECCNPLRVKWDGIPEIGIDFSSRQLWLQLTDRIQKAGAIPTIRMLDNA